MNHILLYTFVLGNHVFRVRYTSIISYSVLGANTTVSKDNFFNKIFILVHMHRQQTAASFWRQHCLDHTVFRSSYIYNIIKYIVYTL